MNISKLAAKNAKQSKSVVCMIALASMLICSVVNLGFSLQRSMIESVLETIGDNQVRFEDVTYEQAQLLSQRREVALADLHLIPKRPAIIANDAETHIALLYSSALGQVEGFKLTAGEPPSSEYEAVIPPHTAEMLGIEAMVGKSFEMICTTVDGSETYLTLAISGVLQEQRMFAATDSHAVFISRELAERLGSDCHLYMRFKSWQNIEETAFNLASLIGLPLSNVYFNEQLLAANFHSPMAVILVAIILLVLCSSGALVVFNAYNLSFTKRIQIYGLLSVIGASPKQIRNCVFIEGLFCTLLGLPFGLLAGTFTGYAGMGALDAFSFAVSYTLSPLAYLLSSAVTVLMVILSVSRPAHKASIIAPVEAVRFSEAAEKTTGRKTVDNVTMNELAKINIIRAKKRLFGIVLSLSLTGILFLGFSTIAFSIWDNTGTLAQEGIAGDIVVTAGSYGMTQRFDPLTIGHAESIQNIDGVTKISTIMTQLLVENTHFSDGEMRYFSRAEAVGVEAYVLQTLIENAFDVESTISDYDKPGNVIAVIPPINQLVTANNSIRQQELQPLFDYVANAEEFRPSITMSFTLTDYAGRAVDERIDLNIIALVQADAIPNFTQRFSNVPLLFMLQDNFVTLGIDSSYEHIILHIDEEKHNNIFSTLEDLYGEDPELSITSAKRLEEELTRQIRSITVTALFIIAVISFAGMMNLIVSTAMGVEYRKKEIGVMMAIGLSCKNIRKLLAREGLFISLICTVFSLVFGLGLGIGLYFLVENIGADYLQFVFPFWPIVGLCIILCLVPYIVISTIAHRLQRLTIVELLGRHHY